MVRGISVVSERPGSVDCLLRLFSTCAHKAKYKVKRMTRFVLLAGYHFAIKTVSLSKHHCSQIETEYK